MKLRVRRSGSHFKHLVLDCDAPGRFSQQQLYKQHRSRSVRDHQRSPAVACAILRLLSHTGAALTAPLVGSATPGGERPTGPTQIIQPSCARHVCRNRPPYAGSPSAPRVSASGCCAHRDQACQHGGRGHQAGNEALWYVFASQSSSPCSG